MVSVWGDTVMISSLNDPVLASYLRDFAQNNDLTGLADPDLFEFFSAYCVYYRISLSIPILRM